MRRRTNIHARNENDSVLTTDRKSMYQTHKAPTEFIHARARKISQNLLAVREDVRLEGNLQALAKSSEYSCEHKQQQRGMLHSTKTAKDRGRAAGRTGRGGRSRLETKSDRASISE